MQVAQPNTLLVAGALVEAGWVAPAEIATRIGRCSWAGALTARAGAGDVRPAGSADDDFVPVGAHDLWLRDHYFSDLADAGVLSTVRRLAGFTFEEPGMAPGGGAQWLLEPVHFHLSRDHMALLHGALASLNSEDAKTLATAILPTLADAGFDCRVLAADSWLLRERPGVSSEWRITASGSEAAWGRNIAAWLPEGPDAARWRRVLNEIQMTWFEHPVNETRAARGELPANSVWLGGPVPPGLVDRWKQLGASNGTPPGDAGKHGTGADHGGPCLLYDDSALHYRFADDRDGWLANLDALGERIEAALASRPQTRIVLAGERETRTLARSAGAPARWWKGLRRLAGSSTPNDSAAGWFHESSHRC